MSLRIPLNEIIFNKTGNDTYYRLDNFTEYKGSYYSFRGNLFAGETFSTSAPKIVKLTEQNANDIERETLLASNSSTNTYFNQLNKTLPGNAGEIPSIVFDPFTGGIKYFCVKKVPNQTGVWAGKSVVQHISPSDYEANKNNSAYAFVAIEYNPGFGFIFKPEHEKSIPGIQSILAPLNNSTQTTTSGFVLDENINFNPPAQPVENPPVVVTANNSYWKNIPIDDLIKSIYGTKFKPSSKAFEASLRQVISWAQQDPRIKNVEQFSYLLGTAFGESGYSLERWEADYVCNSYGRRYVGTPCKAALNYYREEKWGKNSKGELVRKKQNYYNLGVDRNGLPYFGRGLIQLTGKENYRTYGAKIGVDLVTYPELAFEPRNSYSIAVEYMIARKTFTYVGQGNLTQARRSVNGGTNGLADINGAYNAWKGIIKSYEK